MELIPKAPYSFDLLLQILSRYPQPTLLHVTGDRIFRTMRSGTGYTLVAIHSRGTVEQPRLDYEILFGSDDDKLESRISHILGTNRDDSAFYAFARSDERLWNVVVPLVGLPVYSDESVFQALIFVIIEQHIAWATAQRAQYQLLLWANNALQHNGLTYYAMPSPQQLANATIDDLKPTKITFKRMRLIIDISRRVVDGELDLEGLMYAPPEGMYAELLKIKGIGHWTASVVVARSRGIYTYIPHNDVALQAAARKYFGTEKSAQAVTETFAPYSDFAGLAANFTLMRWVLDQYPVRGSV